MSWLIVKSCDLIGLPFTNAGIGKFKVLKGRIPPCMAVLVVDIKISSALKTDEIIIHLVVSSVHLVGTIGLRYSIHIIANTSTISWH
jgi:hypothetical protein